MEISQRFRGLVANHNGKQVLVDHVGWERERVKERHVRLAEREAARRSGMENEVVTHFASVDGETFKWYILV